MAKTVNNKVDSNDSDIDSFLNDMDSFNAGGIESKVNKKSGAKSFTIGAISGVKGQLKSGGFWAGVFKNVLPDEYKSSLENASKLKSTLSGLFDEAVRDVKPGFQQLSRQVDKLVPLEQKRLKSFTTKLNKITGGDQLNNDYSFNEETNRDNTVNTALAQIFALQAEENIRERARDGATKIIKEQTDLTRFNISTAILGNMGSNIDRLVSYNEKINVAYQKKSLELQYRSIFLQTDTLNTNKALLELVKQQNNELIRLSSMSDNEKAINSDAFKKSKKGIYGGMYGSMFGNNAYFDRIKERLASKKRSIVGRIKDGVEKGLMGVDAYSDASEAAKMMQEMGGGGKADMLGSLLGSFGFEYAISHYVKKYKDRILPANSKADNMLGKMFAKMKDLPSLAKELSNNKYLKENSNNSGSMMEKGKGILRDMLGIFAPANPSMYLKSGKTSLGSLTNPSTFDVRTHKSINTIIPGYLARIYRELQITRTGNSNIELTEFSYGKDKFTSSRKLAKELDSSIRKTTDSGSVSYSRGKAMEDITGGMDLSEKAKSVISKRIEDIGFDPSLGLSSKSFLDEKFLNSLPKDVADEIRNSMSAKYNPNDNSFGRKENSLANVLDKYRSSIPDIRSNLEEMTEAGYGSKLSKMRYMKKEGDSYYDINKDKLRDLLSSDKGDLIAKIKELIAKGHRDVLVNLGIIVPDKKDSSKYTYNVEKYLKAVQDGSLDLSTRTSDVHAKGNIRQTLGSKILSGIKKLKPNLQWGYKDGRNDSSEHVGPMAQDIKKNLGEEYAPGGTAVDIVSMNGASISAIKELALEQDKLKRSVGKDSSVRSILLSINSNTEKILELVALGSYKANINNPDIEKLITSGKLRSKDIFGKFKDMFKGKNKDEFVGPAPESNKGSPGKQASFLSKFIEMFIYADMTPEEYMKKYPKLAATFMGLGKAVGSIFKTGSRALSYGKDKFFNTLIPNIKSGGKKGFNLSKSLLGSTLDTVHNTINPLKDIYVKGEESPILFADLIRKGTYIDRDTKRVISTLSDIKGPVVSKEGNIVVTEADILKGLVDVNGKPIQGLSTVLQNKAKELMKKVNNAVTERLPTGIKQVYQAAHMGLNYIRDRINAPKDIYVVGNTKPTLFASVMEAGGYIDQKTGNVIKTLNDIKGQVIDDKGNIILSFSDIAKGLVDVNGKPIRSLKQTAKAVVDKAMSVAKNITSSLFGKSKNLFSGSKDKANDILESLKKANIHGIHIGLGGSDETVKLLKDIKNILKARLPRSSGTSDIHEEHDESSPGFFGRGLSGIKKYLGKIKTGADRIGSGIVHGTGSIFRGTGHLAKSALHGVGKIGGGLLRGTGAVLGGTGYLAGKTLHGVGMAGEGLLRGTGAILKGTGHLAGETLHGIGKIGGGLLRGTGAVLQGAGHAIRGVGGMFHGIKRMSSVDKQEKENHEQRLKEEANKAHVSTKAKYLHGGNIFSGLLDKVKGFKGMLGKAFDILGDIPGISKIGKLLGKVPLLGKLFGGAGEVAGGAEAATAGGGILSGIGSMVSGGLGIGADLLGGVAGIALDTTIAVGGAALGGIASVLSAPIVLGAAVIGGLGYAGYKVYKYATRNSVDALGKYRMAQYGLTENQDKYNHYMLNLEDHLVTNAVGYKNGQAYIIPNKLDVKTVLDIFGVDVKNKPILHEFIQWFNGRFKPVFLNTVSGIFAVNNRIKITETSKLSKDEITKLFPMIQQPSGPYGIKTSPLISQGLSELSADSKYVTQIYNKEYAKYSKTNKDKLAATKKQADRTIKGAAAATAAIAAAKSKNSKKDKNESFIDKTKDVMSSAYSYVKSKAANAYSATKKGAMDVYKYIKTAVSSAGVSALNSLHSAGKDVSQIKDMITKVAIAAGVDPKIMLTIAGIESTFNPNARAVTSSAAGLYQFTEGTWNQMVHEYGSKYGITADTPRTDAKANAIMGAEFLRQNINILKTVKKNPTPADVYMAHFLGAGGAKQILSADPSSIAAQILPNAARANASLFYKGGQALTVGQFYEGMASLVSKKASQFGINLVKPQLTSGGKKSPVVLNNNIADNKTPEATAIPKKNLISNIDPLASKSAPVVAAPKKPAAPEVSVEPMPKPTTVTVFRKPDNTETGQGFHMQKVHEGLSDVSGILTESLSVQRQMLVGINKIAAGSKQTTQQNNVVDNRESKPTQVPKPAVSLSRSS